MKDKFEIGDKVTYFRAPGVIFTVIGKTPIENFDSVFYGKNLGRDGDLLLICCKGFEFKVEVAGEAIPFAHLSVFDAYLKKVL